MDEQLPEISQQPKRIEITEDQLSSGAPMSGAPKQQPQASTADTNLPALSGAKGSSPQVSAHDHPGVGSYCSGCGNPIHPQAVVCTRCGVATTSAAQATGAAMTVALNSKSTGLAIVLSLLFTGAGHWYVGRVGRGLAFFAAAFISGVLTLAIIGFILLPIVWVWAAIDANKCAQEHNRLLLAQAGSQAGQAIVKA